MEPEPEPQPQPARRAESRAEGKVRTRIQGLAARLEACTPPAAAEGAKQGKKGRKGQKPSSRPPPLSAQEAKQWLEAVSAAATLALPTTLEAAAGAGGEQAPWAAEYFALLQRVAQSGPLAGPTPGRFRKAKPPREHAEAELQKHRQKQRAGGLKQRAGMLSARLSAKARGLHGRPEGKRGGDGAGPSSEPPPSATRGRGHHCPLCRQPVTGVHQVWD